MRVVMITHSGVQGGSNGTIQALLDHAPPGTEARWIFLEPGRMTARVAEPWAIVEAGRAREAWKAPRVVRRLRAAIRAANADLVFAHITKSHLYAAPAAYLEGVPYLWWQQELYSQKPVMHTVAGNLPAGAVICSADHTASEQRARFPRTPVVRVHLGSPTENVGAPRVHTEATAPVVGIVGRLQRWKRVELALRAMPAVLAALPHARLRVIGEALPNLDPEYPAELKAEARALGVEGSVDFAGHAHDGAAAIGELDLLVHCASMEPFGLVPVEAMLRGVPVVVPDEGGPRETVRHGVDGLRVDPTETAALAGAIVELAGDPRRRAAMGAAGREHAFAHFTAERMAAEAWTVASAVAERRDPLAAIGALRGDA